MSATMSKDRPNLEELAERFRAIGDFFTGLGEPEQVRRAVDALRADEPTAFRELIDPVPDFPGKCKALCGTVRTVVDEERYVKQKMCKLRWNLTLQERLLAATIYRKHFGSNPTVFEPVSGFAEVTPVIEEWLGPSAYRDELEANNLVQCEQKDVLAAPRVGPPSWECVDLCLP